MARLQPPYQYVIDTSALIDLYKQYPRRIFSGLWTRFEEMCNEKLIIAPKEVLSELRRQDDDLLQWAKDNGDIFLEPSENEVLILARIFEVYPPQIIAKYDTTPWADPLVIACAAHYRLGIIQHESNDSNQYKIPPVARIFGVPCIRLVEFFDEQGWEF